MSAKTYKLSHITDLLNIPSDRLNAALDELKVMIPMMRMSMGLTPEDKTPVELCPSITWVDDDSITAHTVRFRDGSTITASVTREPVNVDTVEPNDHEWFVHAPDGASVGYINAGDDEVDALAKARLKYDRDDVCVTWRKYVG